MERIILVGASKIAFHATRMPPRVANIFQNMVRVLPVRVA